MPLFTSDRERRLWLFAAAAVAAIYSTLGLAGTLAEAVAAQGWINQTFFILFLVLIGSVLGNALLGGSGRGEIWVWIGLATVYGMALLRLGNAERTHLIEYTVVAMLVYSALVERRHGGRHVPYPAVLAFTITVALGWLDEGIQSRLPNRVYDLVDVGFNALAAFMAIVATVVLRATREWDRRRRTRASDR